MTVLPQDLVSQAADLLARCRAAGLTIATAESCTGGLIAAALTEVAGSSDVVECGFITYSDAAKTDMLGVDGGLLAHRGAVSAEAARAMAEGALARSRADLAVAVTGIAGPGGGSAEKPVGLVFLCAARRCGDVTPARLDLGDIGRAAIRLASVRAALGLLDGLAGR